jgi:hypothetical protein
VGQILKLAMRILFLAIVELEGFAGHQRIDFMAVAGALMQGGVPICNKPG